MFVLKLDLGAFILLYFIFRGIRNSQKAKKNYKERKATKKERAARQTVVQAKKKQKEAVLERSVQPGPRLERKEKSVRHILPAQETTVKRKDINKEKPQAKDLEKASSTEKQLVVDTYDSDYQPLELGEVVNGIIWSEILSPPKARRRKILP